MGRDRQSVKIRETKKLLRLIGSYYTRYTTLLAIIAITSAISISVINESHAKDFGVVGHSYEIIEQDIIEYIKQKLENQDLDAINKGMQEKVRERFERPEAVVGIKDSKENREYYYDPTFVLDHDIKDPNGQLIHEKGKVINPLSKVPLSNALIFINGDNKEQVEYAVSQYKELDGKAKIILTSGSPIKLQKGQKEKEEKNEVWFYFDQFGFLVKKLGIKAVPAIVRQDSLRLKINEVVLK